MTTSAKFNLVILWDHEIRSAAKLLHVLKDKGCTADANDILSALQACHAAIYHPKLLDDASAITIMSCNTKLIGDNAGAV